MESTTQNNILWEEMASYISGNASVAEKEMIEKWIEESEANKVLFSKAQKIWEISHSATIASLNTNQAWNKVNSRAHIVPTAKSIPLFNGYRKLLLRVAAAVAVVFCSYFTYQLFFAEMNFYAEGETRQIALADGSTVDLNTHSQLTYPKNFVGNARKVELKGEAFFNITKNPNKPFIIKTATAEIKVLGTSFNVLTCDNGDLEVVVKTGIVKVTSFENAQQVLLVKNEKVRFQVSDRSLVKSISLDENYLSWKTKSFVFKETTLREVFPMLEKVYGLKIEAENPDILNLKLTATFDLMDADMLLKTIDKTFGLASIRTENTVRVDDSASMNR